MDKLGVFHANQTSMCLHPHLNYTKLKLLNNLKDLNCGHVRKCLMFPIIFWTIYL